MEENEINLTIKINEDEINKDIYILNNPYINDEEKEDNSEGLKELNQTNTEIFINDVKNEYKKFKKFEAKGEYKIKIKFHILLKDCYCMFLGCKNMTTVDLSKFNSTNVTNVNSMFKNCYNLTNIDLSNFNTSKVTDMGCMFYFCNNLANINVSNFNTQNVTDMNAMFSFCNNLTNIDLSNLILKMLLI